MPPLRVDHTYTFKFNIGADPHREGVTSEEFEEPDFGERESLDLLLSLFSEDFHIENYHHPVALPRVGSTETLKTQVRPLHEGTCRIEIIVSLAKELEVLQIVEVTVEAVATPIPVADTT